jgi:hypothetical protein
MHTHTHTYDILADIRHVEKMKDLYMKLAELQAEARAPRPQQVQSIATALEAQVRAVNDWNQLVESTQHTLTYAGAC